VNFGFMTETVSHEGGLDCALVKESM
jgi:hypothetical protein